jgi:hypothetical protein
MLDDDSPCFSVVARDGPIYSFLRRLSVRHRIELRRLAWSSSLAPVDHVTVVAAIRMQSQHAVCEESPALSVGRHSINLLHTLRGAVDDENLEGIPR